MSHMSKPWCQGNSIFHKSQKHKEHQKPQKNGFFYYLKIRRILTFQNKGGHIHSVVLCYIETFPLFKSIVVMFSEFANFYIFIQGMISKIEKAIG